MKRYTINGREYLLLENIRQLNFDNTEEAINAYRDKCEEIFSIEDFIKSMLGYNRELKFFIGPEQWGTVGEQGAFKELCEIADAIYTVADGATVDYRNYWLNLEVHNFNDAGVSIEEPIFIEIMGYKVLFHYGLILGENAVLEPLPMMVLVNEV